jgi:multiple sugar transport system ATP-binding protein
LHQRLKTTTVYVTHDQIEAMTMADKIVVMHDGIVEQMGAPLDLYDRPANLFVAGFIGSPSMNFVHGTVDDVGKLSATSKKGATLPFGKLGAAKPGQAIVYGIRPEHIHLSDQGVEAEVVVVEPTGSETQVVVRLKGEEMVCVFRERITAKPGETIKILPDPDLVHLFDAASGKRID